VSEEIGARLPNGAIVTNVYEAYDEGYRQAERFIAQNDHPESRQLFLARDIFESLGYAEWRNFDGLIQRASKLITHGLAKGSIEECERDVGIGSGALRAIKDYRLDAPAYELVKLMALSYKLCGCHIAPQATAITQQNDGQAAPVPQDGDKRAAFEAHFRGLSHDMDFARNGEGYYEDFDTQRFWTGWQAALASNKAAAVAAREPVIPDELNPDTAKLVRRFARALANKLLSAQRKYGYGNSWLADDWQEKCREELQRHVAKGDPRDVAAYCAFMWHHDWSTTATPPAPIVSAEEAVQVAEIVLFGGDVKEVAWTKGKMPEVGTKLYTHPAAAQPSNASLPQVTACCGRSECGGECGNEWRGMVDRPDIQDAYSGAREDMEIWKRRALEAEELNRKFVREINGPVHMGEPVLKSNAPCDHNYVLGQCAKCGCVHAGE